eukprot:gene2783-1768_t
MQTTLLQYIQFNAYIIYTKSTSNTKIQLMTSITAHKDTHLDKIKNPLPAVAPSNLFNPRAHAYYLKLKYMYRLTSNTQAQRQQYSPNLTSSFNNENFKYSRSVAPANQPKAVLIKTLAKHQTPHDITKISCH